MNATLQRLDGTTCWLMLCFWRFLLHLLYDTLLQYNKSYPFLLSLLYYLFKKTINLILLQLVQSTLFCLLYLHINVNHIDWSNHTWGVPWILSFTTTTPTYPNNDNFDWPIAFRRGIRSTQNPHPHPIYHFMSYIS